MMIHFSFSQFSASVSMLGPMMSALFLLATLSGVAVSAPAPEPDVQPERTYSPGRHPLLKPLFTSVNAESSPQSTGPHSYATSAFTMFGSMTKRSKLRKWC